jgi:hypothetical protein
MAAQSWRTPFHRRAATGRAHDFSIAVCAVGSSVEASVLITADLVDLRVPQIRAKAISTSPGNILERRRGPRDLPRA